jgi:hypothetical protein
MGRYILTSAAVLALMSGVAFAQNAPYASSSTTTTTTDAPDSGFHKSVTRHTDENGDQSVTKRVDKSGMAGSSETRVRTHTDPDSGATVVLRIPRGRRAPTSQIPHATGRGSHGERRRRTSALRHFPSEAGGAGTTADTRRFTT